MRAYVILGFKSQEEIFSLSLTIIIIIYYSLELFTSA